MSRRVTRDNVGRASLTLLEAPRSSALDDFPSKFDLEGLGFSSGIEDEFVRQTPTSPISPLTSAVKHRSIPEPEVAIVHRVRLRNFDEGVQAEPDCRIVRRFSTISCSSSTPEKEPMCRFSTVEPIPSADLPDPTAGARPASAGRPGSAGLQRPASAGSQSADAPKVRNLSSEEIIKRKNDTVDWFRASRAINRNIRSIEDAETLLAQARERRSNGTDYLTRKKSKEIPLGDASETLPDGKDDEARRQKETHSVAAAHPPRPRRNVDPSALWAAKPKSKPQEESKPEVNNKCCMRGNVQVGEQGENGLLARLRRRRTIS
jgi:hypothetical protein